MAFADLASNQMVDENNASTGGFASIGPKLPGTQCYSKDAALAAYNLNASAMDGYLGNQLVPKSVWASPVIISEAYPFILSSNFPTAGQSCAASNNQFYLHRNASGGYRELIVGDTLYTDSNLTALFNGGGSFWKEFFGSSQTTQAIQINASGVIQTMTLCSTVRGGGTLVLNIPGYGIVGSNAPGSNVMTLANNASIGCINQHLSLPVVFNTASLSNPYPIITQSGAARLLQFASTPVCTFNTAPQGTDVIPPNTNAFHVSINKTSGGGVVVLSLQTLDSAGSPQQQFWSFSI